jgi:hypothetical protein
MVPERPLDLRKDETEGPEPVEVDRDGDIKEVKSSASSQS